MFNLFKKKNSSEEEMSEEVNDMTSDEAPVKKPNLLKRVFKRINDHLDKGLDEISIELNGVTTAQLVRDGLIYRLNKAEEDLETYEGDDPQVIEGLKYRITKAQEELDAFDEKYEDLDDEDEFIDIDDEDGFYSPTISMNQNGEWIDSNTGKVIDPDDLENYFRNEHLEDDDDVDDSDCCCDCGEECTNCTCAFTDIKDTNDNLNNKKDFHKEILDDSETNVAGTVTIDKDDITENIIENLDDTDNVDDDKDNTTPVIPQVVDQAGDPVTTTDDLDDKVETVETTEVVREKLKYEDENLGNVRAALDACTGRTLEAIDAAISPLASERVVNGDPFTIGDKLGDSIIYTIGKRTVGIAQSVVEIDGHNYRHVAVRFDSINLQIVPKYDKRILTLNMFGIKSSDILSKEEENGEMVTTMYTLDKHPFDVTISFKKRSGKNSNRVAASVELAFFTYLGPIEENTDSAE